MNKYNHTKFLGGLRFSFENAESAQSRAVILANGPFAALAFMSHSCNFLPVSVAHTSISLKVSDKKGEAAGGGGWYISSCANIILRQPTRSVAGAQSAAQSAGGFSTRNCATRCTLPMAVRNLLSGQSLMLLSLEAANSLNSSNVAWISSFSARSWTSAAESSPWTIFCAAFHARPKWVGVDCTALACRRFFGVEDIGIFFGVEGIGVTGGVRMMRASGAEGERWDVGGGVVGEGARRDAARGDSS